MIWRKITLCKFEFLKLSHNIHVFGIFSVATMNIITCCVFGAYYHCVRGGGALVVDDWWWMGLHCMWGGKERVLVFCFIRAYKVLLYMCLTPSCSLENPTGPKWTNDIHWQGKTETVGERPVPLPLCPLHISHGLVWVWTWAFVLKG